LWEGKEESRRRRRRRGREPEEIKEKRDEGDSARASGELQVVSYVCMYV
jgi:hypothetical protein